jgi:hypothetical protein
VRPFRTGGVRRLAACRAVGGPSVLLHGADEVEIHLQIHVLMATWKTDAQVRRTHFESKVHRAERVSERAVQEFLLAVPVVLGTASAAVAAGRHVDSSRWERSRP